MNYKQNESFTLFADTIITRGFKRSTICNLESGTYHLIPNSMFDFICKYENEPIINYIENIDSSTFKIIEEYFTFLLDKNYGFFTSSPESFPKLNHFRNTSSTISNAIIDIGRTPQELTTYQNTIKQLDELQCEAVQFRCYTTINNDFLLSLLNLKWYDIKDIQLFLKYDYHSNELLSKIYDSNQRISFIVLHSSESNKTIRMSKENLQNIYYTTTKISNASHCGIISKEYFSINLKSFLDSKDGNSCLKKKIGIDINGNIKNCPSLKHSYGNILKDKLSDIVKQKEFQSSWSITKDSIQTCKDCEYRNMCTDCRLGKNGYLDHKNKPFKCNYNPYESKWN